jgi:hypothetical protein
MSLKHYAHSLKSYGKRRGPADVPQPIYVPPEGRTILMRPTPESAATRMLRKLVRGAA